MRRPLLALPLLATVLLVAACASATGPSWTYAPPTPAPTPGPSSDASAAPSAAASEAAPSADASGGGSAGTVVQISAVNVAFEQKEVTAPADTAFTIHFNNKEAVPHNVAIKDASGGAPLTGQVITGPKEVDYQVDPLKAGDYQFVCSVHPNMVGTLKVGG